MPAHPTSSRRRNEATGQRQRQLQRGATSTRPGNGRWAQRQHQPKPPPAPPVYRRWLRCRLHGIRRCCVGATHPMAGIIRWNTHYHHHTTYRNRTPTSPTHTTHTPTRTQPAPSSHTPHTGHSIRWPLSLATDASRSVWPCRSCPRSSTAVRRTSRCPSRPCRRRRRRRPAGGAAGVRRCSNVATDLRAAPSHRRRRRRVRH